MMEKAEHHASNPWYMAIQEVDRRFIYVLLMIAFIIPLIHPIGLPINKSPLTQKAFSIIDSLPKGSIVFHSIGFGAATDAEVWPQMVALSKHYMAKGLKVIYFPFTTEGGMYAQRILDQIVPEYGYKYRENVVLLPFKAGGETTIAALKDFYSLFDKDAYGNSLKSMPIFKGFGGMQDVRALVVNTTGDDVNYFVRHIQSTFDVPLLAAGAATVLPVIGPFLASGQVTAAISGLPGAAEYEVLAKVPGKATGAMDAQAFGHLLILGLILIGNLGAFFQRKDLTKGGYSHV